MPDNEEKLTPADPHDVETALLLALTSRRAMAGSQAAETVSGSLRSALSRNSDHLDSLSRDRQSTAGRRR
jgi:hypothetical protein